MALQRKDETKRVYFTLQRKKCKLKTPVVVGPLLAGDVVQLAGLTGSRGTDMDRVMCAMAIQKNDPSRWAYIIGLEIQHFIDCLAVTNDHSNKPLYRMVQPREYLRILRDAEEDCAEEWFNFAHYTIEPVCENCQ